ncbi:18153_t:CDS:2, partial [Racocetra persica]
KDHIVALFEDKKEQIKLTLSQVPEKILFISNIWTASNNIISIEMRHMGFNMANAILNTLYEFNLEKKALALTTDNASLMIICGKIITKEFECEFDDLGFLHYRYVAHILNLIVNKGFEHVDKSITKIRKKLESALNLLVADYQIVRNKYLNAKNLHNINVSGYYPPQKGGYSKQTGYSQPTYSQPNAYPNMQGSYPYPRQNLGYQGYPPTTPPPN